MEAVEGNIIRHFDSYKHMALSFSQMVCILVVSWFMSTGGSVSINESTQRYASSRNANSKSYRSENISHVGGPH